MMAGAAMALVAAAATPLFAQESASQCAAPATPEGALAPWADQASVITGADRPSAGVPAIEPGRTMQMTLHPAAAMQYPATPGKAGDTGYGGLATVDIQEAGTFRVALGSGAWVDLVSDGNAVESIAHGHGPECSGIRKMVDFKLEAGPHTLQIAGNGEAETKVLVVRLPS